MNLSAFSLCSKAHNDLETELVFLKWSFRLSWPYVRVFAPPYVCCIDICFPFLFQNTLKRHVQHYKKQIHKQRDWQIGKERQ